MTKSPITDVHAEPIPADEPDAELQKLREERIARIKEDAAKKGQTTVEVAAGPGAPGLQLWCEAHFQPYRVDRSLNGLLAGKLLTDLLLNDEPFQTMCGRDDTKGKQADATRIQREGGRLGPICCYLGEDARNLVHKLTRDARDAAFQRAADAVIAREDVPAHPTRRRTPESRAGVAESIRRSAGEEDADGS